MFMDMKYRTSKVCVKKRVQRYSRFYSNDQHITSFGSHKVI